MMSEEKGYLDLVGTAKPDLAELKKNRPARHLSDNNREFLKLYCIDFQIKGYSSTDIIRFMERDFGFTIAQRTVLKWMNDVLDDWADYTEERITRRKALEIAKIDNLESTYWEAWEASKGSLTSKSVEKDELPDRSGDSGTMKIRRKRTKETTKEEKGDAQYLKGIEWCITQRCKIYGLSGEKLKVHMNKGDTQTNIINVEALDMETLEKLERAYTQVEQLGDGDEKKKS